MNTSQNIEPDLSGELLDRYRLVRLLGIGGMGAVYEAEHTTLEKRVAVKLLRHELTRQDIARKRFLREAKAATRVKHPNVVEVFDFGETPEGRIYFVMELMQGRDLGELLKAETRLSWERTRHILLQVVSALEAAHAQGILHRDMKPSNCFMVDIPGMEGTDFVKVLDFGIAKVMSPEGEATEGLTSTDEVFGTVAYMAPEMATGVTNDLRSDVYAVGVMMYRMLVGSLPFSEGNAFQILSQHIHSRPPPPRSREPSIAEPIEAIILKTLEKRAEDRIQSMRELADALRRGALEASTHDRTLALPGMVGPAEPSERTMVLNAEGQSPISSSHPSMATALLTQSSLGSGPIPQHGSGPIPQHGSGPIPQHGSGPIPQGYGPIPQHSSGPIAVDRTGPVSNTGRSMGLVVVLSAIAVIAALGVGIYIGTRREAPEGDALVSSRAAAPASEANEPATPKVVQTVPAPKPAEPEPEPEPEVPEPEVPEPEPEPEVPEPEVPEPSKAEERNKKERRTTKPKGDDEVIASLRAKIESKCRQDGKTSVRLEGLIRADGRVQAPLATPGGSLGTCAEKQLAQARFAERASMTSMKRFSVDL